MQTFSSPQKAEFHGLLGVSLVGGRGRRGEAELPMGFQKISGCGAEKEVRGSRVQVSLSTSHLASFPQPIWCGEDF